MEEIASLQATGALSRPHIAYRLVVTDAAKVVPGETMTVTVAFMLE